jgi:hypothetical protein
MPWTIPNLVLHDKPPRLGNVRSHGRKHVFVVCGNRHCPHNAELDVISFPDDMIYGDLQPRMLCTCAIISAPTLALMAASWLIGRRRSRTPLVHPHVGLLQPIYKRFPLGSDFCGKRCSDAFVELQQLVDRH